jgi:hypothetical protein
MLAESMQTDESSAYTINQKNTRAQNSAIPMGTTVRLELYQITDFH